MKDKVWHEELIYKLQQNDILGELLNIQIDFLNNHWTFSFLIYVNNLPESLFTNAKLFADHMQLFSIIQDITVRIKELNNDLKNISKLA